MTDERPAISAPISPASSSWTVTPLTGKMNCTPIRPTINPTMATSRMRRPVAFGHLASLGSGSSSVALHASTVPSMRHAMPGPMRISLGWTMFCCWENFIVWMGFAGGRGGHRCGRLGRGGGCFTILGHGARHGGAEGHGSGKGNQSAHRRLLFRSRYQHQQTNDDAEDQPGDDAEDEDAVRRNYHSTHFVFPLTHSAIMIFQVPPFG